MLNNINKPKPIACAVCNATSAGQAWGIEICSACYGAWMDDDRFSSGVINKFLNISDRIEDFTETNHQRYCAEATRRTKAWVAERKTARAA